MGDSLKMAASVLPECGPVAILQSSPVSQTSPMGSCSATRSYQGWRSFQPQRRPTNCGSMRNGAISTKTGCDGLGMRGSLRGKIATSKAKTFSYVRTNLTVRSFGAGQGEFVGQARHLIDRQRGPIKH